MAVYALINASLPIRNGLAVGKAPQARSGEAPYYKTDRCENLANMGAFGTTIDGRYKTGGTTTWERPGQA